MTLLKPLSRNEPGTGAVVNVSSEMRRVWASRQHCSKKGFMPGNGFPVLMGTG